MKKIQAMMSVISASCLLSACATSTMLEGAGLQGDVVQNFAILGVANKLVAPNRSDLLLYGMVFLIYDPAAPNWEIRQVRINEDVFDLQLRMKRYHTGGAGEPMQVLKRRATQLQQELGYSGYTLLSYEEGIDSETIAARRFGEGRIQLVGLLPRPVPEPVPVAADAPPLAGERARETVPAHASKPQTYKTDERNGVPDRVIAPAPVVSATPEVSGEPQRVSAPIEPVSVETVPLDQRP